MARKKDLAGLATLAGLAYMASRDKEGKGSMPSASTASTAPSAAKEDSAMSSDTEFGDLAGAQDRATSRAVQDQFNANERVSTPATSRVKPKPIADSKPKAPVLGLSDPGSGDAPDTKVRKKAEYETPYDRMNRKNREAREASAAKAKILTSSPAYDSTEDMKKGGRVKKMASGGGVKGWGISRGARKAKNY